MRYVKAILTIISMAYVMIVTAIMVIIMQVLTLGYGMTELKLFFNRLEKEQR